MRIYVSHGSNTDQNHSFDAEEGSKTNCRFVFQKIICGNRQKVSLANKIHVHLFETICKHLNISNMQIKKVSNFRKNERVTWKGNTGYSLLLLRVGTCNWPRNLNLERKLAGSSNPSSNRPATRWLQIFPTIVRRVMVELHVINDHDT